VKIPDSNVLMARLLAEDTVARESFPDQSLDREDAMDDATVAGAGLGDSDDIVEPRVVRVAILAARGRRYWAAARLTGRKAQDGLAPDG
jgi:hypothetical protein